MKQKPKTPYQRLLEEVTEFARKVKYPNTRSMWSYPKGRLHEGWRLDDLDERVQAADQLGYDVVLKHTDAGLQVLYRKRHPTIPWNWNV